MHWLIKSTDFVINTLTTTFLKTENDNFAIGHLYFAISVFSDSLNHPPPSHPAGFVRNDKLLAIHGSQYDICIVNYDFEEGSGFFFSPASVRSH